MTLGFSVRQSIFYPLCEGLFLTDLKHMRLARFSKRLALKKQLSLRTNA